MPDARPPWKHLRLPRPDLDETHGGSPNGWFISCKLLLKGMILRVPPSLGSLYFVEIAPRNSRKVGISVAKMGGLQGLGLDQDDDEARRREASEALLLGSSSETSETCTKRSLRAYNGYNDPKK